MKLQLKRPLIVFDGEFTGLDTENDRLIELSILKLFPDGTRIVKTRRFNPGIPSKQEAIEIHGITDEILANEQPFSKYAKNILELIIGCDIAYYGGNMIDAKFLNNEFSRAGIIWDYSDVNFIDIGNIYKIKEPRDLKTAVQFYCNKEHEGAHGAEADTLATFDVLEAQLEKYEDMPTDIKELALLSNFGKPVLDLSGKFTTDDNGEILINFGPPKGQRAKDNISYLEWMASKNFPADTMRIAYRIMREENQNYINHDDDDNDENFPL